jgi:CheY-like chemotaxis protein
MTFHRSSAVVEELRPFANKSILLAEDNDLNALVFVSFIEEWGCQITKAANGLEAVATAGSADFDLILMDIHMPEMSGNEAIWRIRQFNKNIPIIALTASSLKRDITSSLEAGANDFLLKPVSSHQLKKMLVKYF